MTPFAGWVGALRSLRLCLLPLAFVVLLGGVAGAQEARPAVSVKAATFSWDAPRGWLLLSVGFRDVADGQVLRKLRMGLPTAIVLTGLLYAQGDSEPLASTLQNCKITWHVWEEMYRVEVMRPNHPEVRRHWTPTLNGVLRRCAQAEGLLVASGTQVVLGRPLVFRGKVLVNPVSPELLRKIQRWISQPSNTTAASPGSILFSTFTGLFMTRMGEAERVFEFITAPAMP